MSIKTTVRISFANRERLANIGRKDETFDEIIGKLLSNNQGIGVENNSQQLKHGHLNRQNRPAEKMETDEF